jgi:hypothetical protein
VSLRIYFITFKNTMTRTYPLQVKGGPKSPAPLSRALGCLGGARKNNQQNTALVLQTGQQCLYSAVYMRSGMIVLPMGLNAVLGAFLRKRRLVWRRLITALPAMQELMRAVFRFKRKKTPTSTHW